MTSLSENVFNRSRRRDQPKLKVWRYAGILLTYRCPCRCDFCTYACGPESPDDLITPELAVAAWQSLIDLAGPRAKVHLTGGEPFLAWDRLCEILQGARRLGLPPLDCLETNGFWATDDTVIRRRLERLDRLGMVRLKISCDPYHQRFVPAETVRRLVDRARSILGPDRVQVRWERHLTLPAPRDVAAALADPDRHQELLARDPVRPTGRAAALPVRSDGSARPEDLAGRNCLQTFLDAKGVHIDPYGHVFSGTCSGIIVDRLGPERTLEQAWRDFDPLAHPVIGPLCRSGPTALLKQARDLQVPARLAGRCHLCTLCRRDLVSRGQYRDSLGPRCCYPA